MLVRVQITGSVILGLACLSTFLIAPTELALFASVTGRWWTWLGIAVVVAAAAALIGVAVGRRPDLLGYVAVGCAAAYVLLLIAWFVGWTGETVAGTVPSGPALWVIYLPQAIGCVFVLAGRLRPAIGTVIVAGGLSLAVTTAASGHGEWVDLAQACWLLTLSSLYQLIAWAVVSGAGRLDDQRELAARDAVARLQSGSRGAERRRVDAMVHDRLIALLLALRPGQVRPGLVDAITGVLDELQQWRSDDVAGDRSRIPSAEVAQRLRLSLDDIGDEVQIEIEVRSETDYPAQAADAVIEAVGEAVRNVGRHAGRDAACAVVCELDAGSIMAVVIDNGVGFVPEEIPATRIGVALGIMERMDVLDGGDSRIDSEPGVGTRVEVSWTAPGGAR